MLDRLNKDGVRSFGIFVVGVAGLIFLPSLLQYGMFLDGVTYAAIANNMNTGQGSAFVPFYSETLYPNFYEHPPFAFIMQSLFQKVFGGGLYGDRIYSYMIFVLCTIAIYRLMANCRRRCDGLHFVLAIFFILTVPLVTWSYKNNMLENSVILFTLLSTSYFVRFSHGQGRPVSFLLGCIFAVLAFLVKGPVGLFSLVCPIMYGLVFGRSRRGAILSILAVFLSLLILLFAISVFPDLGVNLKEYLSRQVFPAITGKREVSSQRSAIILELFLQLGVLMVVLLCVAILQREKRLRISRWSCFFLLIGLSAFVPLFISAKLHRHYLTPSIVFFCIGGTSVLLDIFARNISLILIRYNQVLRSLGVVCVIIGLTVCILKSGTFARDEVLIRDTMQLTQIVPQESIISGADEFCENWQQIAYFARIGQYSLDCSDTEQKFKIISNIAAYESANDYKVHQFTSLAVAEKIN